MNKIGIACRVKSVKIFSRININTDNPASSYSAFKTVQGNDIGYVCSDGQWEWWLMMVIIITVYPIRREQIWNLKPKYSRFLFPTDILTVTVIG